jgi:hypothetical protein
MCPSHTTSKPDFEDETKVTAHVNDFTQHVQDSSILCQKLHRHVLAGAVQDSELKQADVSF